MKSLGQLGEQLAAEHYKRSGFTILEKNFIFPKGKQMGELDLVCLKGKEIVFVEVKYRSSGRFGGPFEAVDMGKQRRLVRTAKLYLSLHPEYQNYEVRIDVAAVDIDNKQTPVIILANAIEDLD
jgi:putative endonuclease